MSRKKREVSADLSEYADIPERDYSTTVDMLHLPIDLTIPESIADRMPQSKRRLINGRFLLRFFPDVPPAIGHTIVFRGHRWLVVGIEHVVQIARSPAADCFPTFEMEYLGTA